MTFIALVLGIRLIKSEICQMIHDVFQITKNCKIPSKIFRFIKIQLSKLGLKVTQFLVKYKPVIITSLGLNLEVS